MVNYNKPHVNPRQDGFGLTVLLSHWEQVKGEVWTDGDISEVY
jgi:hypothetical protein